MHHHITIGHFKGKLLFFFIVLSLCNFCTDIPLNCDTAERITLKRSNGYSDLCSFRCLAQAGFDGKLLIIRLDLDVLCFI